MSVTGHILQTPSFYVSDLVAECGNLGWHVELITTFVQPLTWLWLSRLVRPDNRNILGVLFRSTGLWCSPECYQQTSHHQHKCLSVFKNVNMLKFWLFQLSQVSKWHSAWTWQIFLLNWRKRRRVKGGTGVKKKKGGCVKKFLKNTFVSPPGFFYCRRGGV